MEHTKGPTFWEVCREAPALLDRLAAAIETPADLDQEELKDVVEDACVMADDLREAFPIARKVYADMLEALKEIVVDLQFSEVEQHKNLVILARQVIAKTEGKGS